MAKIGLPLRRGLAAFEAQLALHPDLLQAWMGFKPGLDVLVDRRIKREQTPVIVVSPETASLYTTGVDEVSQLVSGKSGGLGMVAAAQLKGLHNMGIPTYMITLNLQRRFQESLGWTPAEWQEARLHRMPDSIKLVTSPLFSQHRGAYEGDPTTLRLKATDFQQQAINYVKEIRQRHDGQGIVIANDWMSGGIFAAYCRLRKIPMLYLSHNSHTNEISWDMLYPSTARPGIQESMYRVIHGDGTWWMDSHATGVMASSISGHVGRRWLDEIINDHFVRDGFIGFPFREQTKLKYDEGRTAVLPNGISPDEYPENQEENPDHGGRGLAARFGPDSDVSGAKQSNLLKFQSITGLRQDKGAILLYWPSRFDPNQKGTDLLDKRMIYRILFNHPEVQIAFVGDAGGRGQIKRGEMIDVALHSGGRVTYHNFNEDLSTLGYAASDIVFGSSLYEPFGQIDVTAWLFGAISVNRETGGYHDKMLEMARELRLSPRHKGMLNYLGVGVLFRDYDTSGLEWGLNEGINQAKFARAHPDQWREIRREAMQAARKLYSLDTMMANYIPILTMLNGGQSLLPSA